MRVPPALGASGKASKGWTMTHTIVLAIEQGTAELVARTGGELAKALGARVVLAHVREDPRLFHSTLERERARGHATRSGRQILDRAHDMLPSGVDADERVELGIAVNRLTEIADEVEAALIVVGTRGRGRLASALRGSVSRTLAHQAPCPVMIVPDTARATHVGYPTGRASVRRSSSPWTARRSRATPLALRGSSPSVSMTGWRSYIRTPPRNRLQRSCRRSPQARTHD